MELLFKYKIIHFVLIISFIIFLIYILFYFLQDRMLFYPQPITAERVNYINSNYSNVEEITLQVNDSTSVHGWLVKNEMESPSPLLIYFGGNAEEVSHLIGPLQGIKSHSILLMNYRGYGKSDGTPGEIAMFHDALAIYDFITEMPDINHHDISVLGRSMGTGVAVYVAEQRMVEKLILVSPYDSLTNVARSRYPLVPVSLLLNHNFDNISRAPDIHTPLLLMIASEDRVIPPEYSENLGDMWGGHTTISIFDGKNHNNIQSDSRYWEEIEKFIQTKN
ncbi:alpha/beta hydrolase [Evansella tamaricis]|uniref:Lysophospholipase n=1 Tax=Evansella tamaricis TaxID=2069301 RepID=A0ABS6JEF9_9BACI|nr:alpha/beta hydrolase [Evansella tamaricis]MBU9711780.1 lysophospholipase [Evansella tamaricis]